jgi:DNA-binding SARP family transcriptional activator
MTSEASVVCHVLGPARITVRGEDAPPELLWRKHLALLVYLARSPRRGRTREHLVGLLWSDRDEKQARHSLSEALRVYRRVLGDAGIEADVDQVRLADGALALDCDIFAERRAREDWIGAAELVAGEFLEGLAVPDASAFEDWLTAERGLWRGQCLDALVRAAETLVARGDPGRAAALAQRALEIDPAAEPAAHVTMRALALAGDRTGALRIAEELARELADQFAAAPGPETLRLAERIREGRVGRRFHVAPEPGRSRPPLIGRAVELAQLSVAWEAIRAGGKRGQIVLVEGELGLGKTRLIEEIVARAQLDDATVARARLVPAEEARAWSGLTGLLAGGLGEAPGLAGASASALASLGALDPDVATRFPAQAVPLPVAAAWSAAARAAAAEQPLLLALDDAQFLDRETAGALPGLARDVAGHAVLLVIGVTTGVPSAGRFDELRSRIGRDLAGTAIRLGSFDTAALRALVTWGLPRYGPAEADRLVRRLERDTAGIPLLAVSLVEAVAEGFRLSPETASWPAPKRTLVDTLPGDLPAAVVGAVCARFHRLPAPAQQVLGAAAALERGGGEGGRVEAEGLAHATGLEQAVVNAALDRLEWDRWLVTDARGYVFAAPIEREILLQEMLTPGQVQRYRDSLRA